MKRITFDIETEGDFRGNGDFSNLEITVVALHDSSTGEFSSFYREELGKLWPVLESADILVGYNSEHFDIPPMGPRRSAGGSRGSKKRSATTASPTWLSPTSCMSTQKRTAR